MSKREVVWLIVKLIGVYFTYLTIVSVFSLVNSVSILSSVSSRIPTIKTDSNSAVAPESPPGKSPISSNKKDEKSDTDTAQKKLADEAFKTVLFYILLTALYGTLGFYLIKDGRVLFALLNREEIIVKKPKEIISLDISDVKK